MVWFVRVVFVVSGKVSFKPHPGWRWITPAASVFIWWWRGWGIWALVELWDCSVLNVFPKCLVAFTFQGKEEGNRIIPTVFVACICYGFPSQSHSTKTIVALTLDRLHKEKKNKCYNLLPCHSKSQPTSLFFYLLKTACPPEFILLYNCTELCTNLFSNEDFVCLRTN